MMGCDEIVYLRCTNVHVYASILKSFLSIVFTAVERAHLLVGHSIPDGVRERLSA